MAAVHVHFFFIAFGRVVIVGLVGRLLSEKELVVWVTFRTILTLVIQKSDYFSLLTESLIANYGR